MSREKADLQRVHVTRAKQLSPDVGRAGPEGAHEMSAVGGCWGAKNILIIIFSHARLTSGSIAPFPAAQFFAAFIPFARLVF
jgi:hypothetical protein